ncbi:MAG: hypothetical protein AB8E15_00300 [Bdellovibrionales bacterium]
MRFSIIPTIILFVGTNLFAQNSNQVATVIAKQSFNLKQFQTVKVVGSNLELNLKSSESSNLKLNSSGNTDISAEVDAGVLLIQVNGSSSTRLDIQSAAVDLDISFEKLKLIGNNWSGNIDLKGKSLGLKLEESQGRLNINSLNGNAQILSHKGNVRVDSFSTAFTIKSLEGKLNFTGFQGNQVLNNVKGDLDLSVNQGSLKVTESEGDLNLTSNRASLQLLGQNGNIKAKLKLGKALISLADGKRLRVNSEEAPVTVSLPKTSGAHVNVGTKDGELFYPRYLEMKRYPQWKVASGRLRGSKNGSVYVRTEKAKVRLVLK